MPTIEKPGLITMHDNPLTLIGDMPKTGDIAADFEALDQNLNPVKLSQYTGKVCIIASVPSLDTSVCDTMARKFAQEALALGPDVQLITISMDLPFAQKRWCGAADVNEKQVIVLSDHREASFALAWGMLIKELRLIARGVFVIDKSGVLRHIELVKEQSREPDYDAAIAAARKCL